MERSPFDIAVDILSDRRQLAKDELKSRFKRTRPFRKDPVSEEEQLYYYNQMTTETLDRLIADYGEEAANNYLFKMNQLEEKFKNKKGVK